MQKIYDWLIIDVEKHVYISKSGISFFFIIILVPKLKYDIGTNNTKSY